MGSTQSLQSEQEHKYGVFEIGMMREINNTQSY